MGELATYYRERAAEYDAVYTKPERQADLAALHELLPRLVAAASVLEVAAGTGYWTRTMSATAKAVTATDINAETLAVARTREYGPAAVSFQVADAYALDQVPGDFDLVFAGFFWSHVLRADVPRFLDGLRTRLAPGSTVIVADNMYAEGSSTPVSRISDAGDTYQQRTLADGRGYEIVKNFPTREQFTADVGTDVAWTQFRYFWLAAVTL